MSQGATLVMYVGMLMGSIYPCLGFSQAHNGEVYRQLADQYFTEYNRPFREVEGEYPRRYFPPITLDSTSAAILKIAPAIIRYKRLADTAYIRSVDITVAYRDSATETFTYHYADTLSNVNLRRVIRKSPDSLRGDNPLIGAKWIRPVALIGLSITGLVSLFFLRSG